MKNIIGTILILTLFSCKETSQEENKIPEIPAELNIYTLEEIQNLYYYMFVDRWNTNGDIATINGTNYSRISTQLNIPITKLESIDDYYYHQVEPFLRESITKQFENDSNIKTDYYAALVPTAYCGVHTLMAHIEISKENNHTDLKKEAEMIAENLIPKLPSWITGFKLNFTTYKNTYLGTEENIDIGFLWRKGDKIKIMKSSVGLCGWMNPENNDAWHTEEWNDGKKIKYPNIK